MLSLMCNVTNVICLFIFRILNYTNQNQVFMKDALFTLNLASSQLVIYLKSLSLYIFIFAPYH